MTKPTILILDDKSNWRQILIDLLKDDYNLVQAINHQTARQVLNNPAISLDVAVLDINLDDDDMSIQNEDGLQVARFIKQNSPATKIIIVTGFPNERIYHLAFNELNVFAFFEKFPSKERIATEDQIFNYKSFREMVKRAVNQIEI